MPTTYEIHNPATGKLVGTYTNDEPEKVKECIAAARVAQKEWTKLSFKQRAKHLQKMKRFLAANIERAVDVICAATGKVRQDALGGEVLPCLVGCEWYATETSKVLKPQKLPCGNIAFFNKSNTLVYEPVGVVGIISPWNYPFSIPFGEILMGLMAGNAVLLKVGTNVSNVGLFIAEVMEAGELPPGLFHNILLPGPVSGPAFLSGGVDKLFFTGSVRVGKELMRLASETLTPLSLELGGNDAMVVLKDACIERAVNCACWGAFQNAGQSCGGVERLYVEAPIYDEFLAQLCKKTASLRHGPDNGDYSVEIGAMTTKGQYEAVKRQLDEAVSMGAKVVAQSQPRGNCDAGWFVPATVLTGCTMEMSIMREETFGPLLPIVKVEDEEEAIRLANDCTLALTNSVFTKNGKKAQKIARRLDSGVVTINDHLYSHGMVEAPWGGWKESGLGRTHGYLGLKEMCNVKCINDDCFPMNRNLWWYPFDASTYETMKAAARFVAPLRCCESLGALFKLIGSAGFMMSKWIVKDEARRLPSSTEEQ